MIAKKSENAKSKELFRALECFIRSINNSNFQVSMVNCSKKSKKEYTQMQIQIGIQIQIQIGIQIQMKDVFKKEKKIAHFAFIYIFNFFYLNYLNFYL